MCAFFQISSELKKKAKSLLGPLQKQHDGGGDYEEAVRRWMASSDQPVLCSPLDLFTKGEEKKATFASDVVVEKKDGEYVLTKGSIEDLKKKVIPTITTVVYLVLVVLLCDCFDLFPQKTLPSG
jgi:hypothetical protein